MSEDQHRWTARVFPLLNGESNLTIEVHAPDVTSGEIARALVKLAALMLNDPTVRLPTMAEREEMVAEEQLVAAHPATRIYVRDGENLWLSEAAPVPKGFVDVGPVPPGVKRGCDWARDPEAFEAAHREE